MLRFRNLGSGSTGNSTVVEARSGCDVVRLLIDCGLGIRHLEQRLGHAGLGRQQIDAIFITHEHSDHVGCALTLALTQRTPVWMSHGTYVAIGSPHLDGLLHITHDGDAIDFGALQVRPFTVPHDAREPLQLRCTDGAAHLGIVTDLGHASSHVIAHLQGCHALMLESNHDPDLLAQSRYPDFLKRRVAGPFGHLANEAAAEVAGAVRHAGLRQVVAAHLSEQNNRPALARGLLAQALGWDIAQVEVADPRHGTRWIDV